MIISLVRLPVDGLGFEHRYQAGELDTRNFEFEVQAPPLVTGRVDRVGMDMRVRGNISGEVAVACARCLKQVPIRVDIPFDLLYAPEDPGGSRTGEIELHAHDMDFSIYERDEIDLDAMVLEQIELDLPSRALCRDDCRGLCSQCGIDLNTDKCSCQ
jgi:uncharacterized protein